MAPRSKLPARRRVLDSLLCLEDRSVPAAAFLLTDTALLAFDTANPTAAGTALTVTGVADGDTLVGIDFRPANGVLYGLGVNPTPDAESVTLYAINTRTGVATAVGSAGSLVQADGTTPVDLPDPAAEGYGFDFNPAADRVRVITTTGLNFRIDPNTGEAVDTDAQADGAQPDPVLNGQALGASGAAYTNNSPVAAATTLYVLDQNGDQILIQNPANAGTLTSPLDVTLGGNLLDITAVNGFDIPAGVDVANSGDPATGSAFAALTVGTTAGLYQINLATGAATLVGTIGNGAGPTRGLAVRSDPGGLPAVGLSADGTQLVRFTTGSPGTASAAATISGVDPGDVLVGIDYRPATGQLYALGVATDADANAATLYLIDINPANNTATATAVGGSAGQIGFTADGNVVDLPPASAGYGFDFNPANGLIRVTTGTGLNFRVDPDAGAGVDADDNPDNDIQPDTAQTGLPQGSTGATGAAYTTGSNAGATTTTLYVLDAASNSLLIQGATGANPPGPNGGVLSGQVGITLGGNALDFTEVNGFDIPAAIGADTSGAAVTGSGYALLTVGTTTSLYRIDLATGAATDLGAPANLTGGAGLAVGDAPAGTANIDAGPVTVNEGAGTVSVTLTRTGGSVGPLTVTVGVTGGTAGTDDFGPVPATVTFADGETTANLVIPIADDAVTEDSETITLAVSAPTGGGLLGAGTTAMVTILDNEPAAVSFVAAAETVAEDDAAGQVVLTLRRTGDLSAVDVTVAVAGAATNPATNPDDFGGVFPATVSFEAGQTEKTLTIPIVNDTAFEGDEGAVFTITGVSNNGVPGAQATNTLTITDAEDNPGTFAFTGPTFTVAETGSPATINLVRTGGSAGAVDVTVNLSAVGGGSATSPDDFDGTVFPVVVPFAAGQTEANFTLPVVNDAAFEGDETVNLVITQVSGGAISAQQPTTQLTITDAEDASGAITIAVDPATVGEGAGSVTVTLTRAGSTAAALTVPVTLDPTGTATEGNDFGVGGQTPTFPATVTFEAGSATATLVIPITDDAEVEGDETIVLGLGELPLGATPGDPATATVTITDNDIAGTIQFDPAAVTVDENAGTATVTLTRADGSAGRVTVQVTVTGGSATPETDYTPPAPLVTFEAGETTKTVTIPIANDTVSGEGAETILLLVDTPTDGAVIGAQNTATVTINDTTPVTGTVAFDAAASAVVENVAGGNATITVTRAGDTTGPATVMVNIVTDPPPAGGTAVAGTDFTGTAFPVTVNFAANETSKTVSLPVSNNPARTGNRTVVLTLSDPTGAALGAVAQTTVTISDAAPLDNLVVISGQPNGAAQTYQVGTNGALTPVGTPANPFPGFTGVVRSTTADVNGDGTPDTIYVTGPGTPVLMTVISGATGNPVLVPPVAPFAGSEDFAGGAFVAAGDIDGDGRAEWVVTPDQGGGPRTTIFGLAPPAAARLGGRAQATDATAGTLRVRADILGIDDASFRGGARAALGDVNGDGVPDLAVAAGFLGGPRVALFDGKTLLGGTPTRLVNDFFAFPGADAQTLRNGAFVTIGDLTGDGKAELIFGGGPGGAPRVFVLNGQQVLTAGVAAAQAAPVRNFFVGGDDADRGGARLAVADADGDGLADLSVGSGHGRPGRVRTYPGSSFASGAADTEPTPFSDLSAFGGVALTDGIFIG